MRHFATSYWCCSPATVSVYRQLQQSGVQADQCRSCFKHESSAWIWISCDMEWDTCAKMARLSGVLKVEANAQSWFGTHAVHTQSTGVLQCDAAGLPRFLGQLEDEGTQRAAFGQTRLAVGYTYYQMYSLSLSLCDLTTCSWTLRLGFSRLSTPSQLALGCHPTASNSTLSYLPGLVLRISPSRRSAVRQPLGHETEAERMCWFSPGRITLNAHLFSSKFPG